jgi:hypothetical protein
MQGSLRDMAVNNLESPPTKSESANRSMPVVLLGWKPLRRNTLQGFASIRLGATLKIHDVAVHRHENGRRWAQLPAKPILQADGSVKRDGSGKVQYAPLLEWSDRAASDRFSEAVIEAIEAQHPGAV